MQAVFKTDKGKVRPHNEDNGGIFTNGAGNILAIVADGMGGHNAGEVASEIAVEHFKERWSAIDNEISPTDAENWFKENISAVNKRILEHAAKNTKCEGMGTTIVAAICTEQFATVTNIGDSRCYLLNEQGLSQVTEDHSFVNELVKTGQISPEDAKHHPRKNIVLKAVGSDPEIEVDTKTITWEQGDKILLCSDGLSDKVSKEEMIDVLNSSELMHVKAEQLIKYANEYGGEDNISLAIVDYEACVGSGCNEC